MDKEQGQDNSQTVDEQPIQISANPVPATVAESSKKITKIGSISKPVIVLAFLGILCLCVGIVLATKKNTPPPHTTETSLQDEAKTSKQPISTNCSKLTKGRSESIRKSLRFITGKGEERTVWDIAYIDENAIPDDTTGIYITKGTGCDEVVATLTKQYSESINVVASSWKSKNYLLIDAYNGGDSAYTSIYDEDGMMVLDGVAASATKYLKDMGYTSTNADFYKSGYTYAKVEFDPVEPKILVTLSTFIQYPNPSTSTMHYQLDTGLWSPLDIHIP